MMSQCQIQSSSEESAAAGSEAEDTIPPDARRKKSLSAFRGRYSPPTSPPEPPAPDTGTCTLVVRSPSFPLTVCSAGHSLSSSADACDPYYTMTGVAHDQVLGPRLGLSTLTCDSNFCRALRRGTRDPGSGRGSRGCDPEVTQQRPLSPGSRQALGLRRQPYLPQRRPIWKAREQRRRLIRRPAVRCTIPCSPRLPSRPGVQPACGAQPYSKTQHWRWQ